MKKNRYCSNKPRRSKSSLKRLQRKQQKTRSSSEFGYENLEPRYALDASFSFDNGNLNLDDFSGDVIISGSGNTITATLTSGSFSPEDPDDVPDEVSFGGDTLVVEDIGSVTVDLNGNGLFFGESDFNQPFTITDAGLVTQVGPVELNEISITGPGDVLLAQELFDDDGNILVSEFNTVDVDVDGNASIASDTSISGDTFIAANILITSAEDVDLGVIGSRNFTTSVNIDAAEIDATSVATIFTSVADDVNNVGRDPITSVRLRATGGLTTIGILDDEGSLISDTPVARDNTDGGITIDQTIFSDQVLLQSSNGIDIPVGGLDALFLFLGGVSEVESRGEFQLDVPSLQELSVNLFDGFAITSQQDLTVGAFTFTGVDDDDETTTDDEFDDLEFTTAFSDMFASITATSLTFDAPFQSQKLVADITVDIEQNPGAVLTVDDLYLSGESVILDDVNNDFQRIAAVGRGFLADNRQNNEDILTIRDQGTLEIAVLDNQPEDTLVVNFQTPIATNTLEGISVAGQVDILTGFGSPIRVAPDGAVEPSFEQLGNTPFGNEDFRIERFEIPRDRSGTETGIFRDDNYNGAIRPVYFIEFFYDEETGQDVVIRTDQFERGNPEPVRNFIDIELALYDEFGQLIAVGQELSGQLDEIAIPAGGLDTGRYFVAASAFSTEFEDDFVVRTANIQTGTLNVTITGNDPVTPVLSRDLTQAIGAPLIVQGGEEPIPVDEQGVFGPDAFPPEVLVQLDPNAADFAPAPFAVDDIGDPLPETDGLAILGALNGGTVQLGQIDTNDIRELIVTEAGAVEFANTDDLVVSSLDVSGDSRLAAGRGGEGQLTVGDIDSSTLLLQAASGVAQEGALTTDLLLLGGDDVNEGGGDFVILSDTLENVAFNLPTGNLALTTSQELNLVAAQFNDPEDPTVPSFSFAESAVSGTARIEAASITINTQVQAETVVLNAQESISQVPTLETEIDPDSSLLPSTPAIVATSLSISATTADLNQPNNAITRLAGEVTDSLELVNQNPIVFATINNTVETITRLRPLGVSQNFEPLETINGLSVDGTANITSGLIVQETSPLENVELVPIVGDFTQEFDAPLNIGSANFTALNDGDIVLLNPDNDVNFTSTDARDINVQLVDGSVVTDISADRDLLIQSNGALTIANATSIDGSVTINTGDDVEVGEITANVFGFLGGTITINSGGSILGFSDLLTATGTITLNAFDRIDGIDLADQSLVAATSIVGDISLIGVGDLALENVNTVTGTVNVTTAGDVLVGSVNSGSTIDIDSAGSINDLQDDLAADFTAAGLVTLNAIGDVGGGATPSFFDTAGQLEFAPGTLAINSTDGDISVGGSGPLVFEDITTPTYLVISSPDSLTIGNVTALSATLSAVTDVTITSVTTENQTTISAGRNLVVGDVTASEVTLTALENIDAANVTAVNEATIFAGLNLNVGNVVGSVATLAAQENLNAANVTASTGDVALQTTSGDLVVGSAISENATVTIDSGANITATRVVAQNNANLTALVGNITTTQDVIAEDGTATLISGSNVDVSGLDVNEFIIEAFDDIILGDVAVTESANLVSNGAIETGDITATFIDFNAGTSLDTGNLVASTGDVELTSTTELVTGDVTADSGDISIVADQVLETGTLAANNVSVNTSNNSNIGAVAAVDTAELISQGVLNVTTVDAQTAFLNAAGAITFNAVNTIGDAELTAGDGNLNGAQVVSQSGAVSLNSLQRINVAEATASGDVTFEAGNAVNTNLVVSETAAVTINADGNLSATVVDAATNVILTTPRSDLFSDSVTAGESAQLTTGAFLFTRNVEAPDVVLNAGTNQTALRVIADTATITAEIDLRVNDIQVGQLTLEAGDDIFDAGFLDGNRVTTDNLVIRAGNSIDEETFGGVVLETDVNTLTVITEGESFGNIVIRELDDIVLGDIQAGNGGVTISAGGSISGGNVSTVVQNDNNDVRLIATGDASDIQVDQIDVGSGDAFLIADDDVVITGGTGQVSADYIFVLARNRSAGETDGIALSTNVVAADLVVGDIADANQNRGDIVITDANALNVNFARTLNGTISATANGNLVTNNIQSTGVNVPDAIRLTANGLGSDVVTNRVAVFQQAGGVVLTADDDVRDANTSDNLLVIADNLTLVAENNLDDAFDGINSQSRVRSINATVDSSLVIPDGNLEGVREASILINNTGLLTINEANLANGLVRVFNNGFLTVADVNLTGTSSDNRVFVQTTGNASNISVGRINAGLRGAVILDSADDIFDTDQLDDLFVEGGFLSAISRNGTVSSFDGIILNVDVDSFVADAQRGGEEFVRQVS